MQKIILMLGLFSLSYYSYSQAPSLWWKLDGTNVASGSSAVGTSNNESLRFVTNGTERLRIAPNGEYFLNNLTGISNGLLGIKDDGLIYRIDYTGNNNDVLHGDGTFGPISNTSGWNILNSVLYSDHTKNVAIGTNLAPEKLTVAGNILTSGNILAAGSISGTALNVIDIVTSGKEFKISTSLCLKGIDVNTPGSRNELCGLNGDLFVQSTNANYNTVINYGNVGKVGIGVMPTEDFHVGVKARFDQDIFTNKIYTNRITSTDSIIHFGDSSITIQDNKNQISWTNTIYSNPSNPSLFLQIQGFTLGRGNSIATGNNSIALGTNVSVSGFQSFVIGSGINTTNRLSNNQSNSLMIGFNSNIPTFFISKSNGNNETGAVGIATTFIPEGYKLAVHGKVIAEEIDVRLRADWPWPDYVFDEKFVLTPISEVKKFYTSEKHLPGFPSSQDIDQKKSFGLGEITRLQQEHIEKLTIYLAEQNEEIETLKEQNALIQDNNDKLLERLTKIEKMLLEDSND